MNRSNDPETSPKAIGHDYDLVLESYWRRGITEQYNYIEDGLLANIDTAIKEGARRMMETAAAIAGKDAHMAERLAKDIPTGKDLNERLWRAINKHMRNQHSVNILSAASERSHSPGVEPMVIDSDGDEPESVAGLDARGDSAMETHNETHGERTEDSEPDAPVPRPQRIRHAYHPQGLSGPPIPEPENIPNLPRMRTILAEDVEKKDFIFPYPEVEPGYFVIRCDSNAEAVHHFEAHPLVLNRATRHFVQPTPKRKCHRSGDAVLCREKETVLRRFGYRVVDEGGSDVDSDWVERSNGKLTKEVERKKRAKSRPKVGKTSGRIPPRTTFGRRAKRGITPRTASMFSELNTSRSEAATAGPSNRGGAPVAEMGAADLWAAQAAEVYSADWNPQEDADAMFPVTRIASDIPSAGDE